MKTDARRVTVRATEQGWDCAMCSFPSLCAVRSVECGPVFFCLLYFPVTEFVFLFWVYRVFFPGIGRLNFIDHLLKFSII